MALSGSVSTNKYEQRYLTLTWTATQSIANNTSTITWVLKGAGGSTTLWYYAAPFKVEINGKTEYESSSRIKLYNGTEIKKGTTTIKHNNDGKKSFSVKISGAIYNAATNCAGSKSFTLDQIARSAELISAPNFSDEQNPTIKYNNPLGTKITSLQACITLDDNDTSPTIPYRNIPKDESKYTFNLTYADKENLYNNITNSDSAEITFYVKSVIGDTTYKSKLTRTVTIVNAEPQIECFRIVDINTKSLALTNDAHKIIEGFNTIDIEVQPVVKKGATLKKTVVVCGDGKKIIGNTGQMQNVTSADFTISVTDSRKKTAKVSISKTPVKYIPLTCDLAAKAKLQGEKAAIDFSIKGKFFDGNFGNLANSIVVVWRYKTTDESDYGNWHTVLNLSYGTNSYSYSGSISNLDYTKTYQVQAYVSDSTERTGVFSKVITTSAKPVFDWGKGDFNFNVPVNISVNNTSGEGYYNTTTKIGGGLNLNNNDIVGANSIYFSDQCNNTNEGICFPTTDAAETYDVLKAYNGKLLFIPKAPTNTTAYKLCYCAGDSMKISSYTPLAAYVSSSRKAIFIGIPINKPLVGVSSVSISGKLQGRGITGYLYNATSKTSTYNLDNAAAEGFTYNCFISGDYVRMSIAFEKALTTSSDGTTTITNNTPVSITPIDTLTITFS